MKEKLEKRLTELKAEFEQGEKMLSDLDAKREQVSQTMLRISGAIQVIEEMLKEEESTSDKPSEKSE